MAKFGDIRLRDSNDCGHHPEFATISACVEKFQGPIRMYKGFVPYPSDEKNEDGEWGQWISVGILGCDGVERLSESLANWLRGYE